MATGNVKYIRQRVTNRKTVWVLGTDTLNRGYALCYDQDATENGTTPEAQLGYTVEQPATANLLYFAGFYSGEQGEAFQAPGYITIDTPVKGEMYEVYTDSNMTVGTTILAAQDGSYALKTLTSAASFENGAIAIAGVTENTDSTNALSTVYIIS